MAWLRIDDGFDHHPKILALASDQRRWTWTRILVYTCRYRSAVIPTNIHESIPRATAQFLRECVDIGLIDDTDEGLTVHDWDAYNGSDPRVVQRERQRRHRDNTVTPTVTPPLRKRDSRAGARARPVPSPTPTTKAGSTSTRDPTREPPANSLPFAHQLLTTRILSHIGNHADEGTSQIIHSYATHLPENTLAKVLESSETTKPSNRAAYVIAALRDEIGTPAPPPKPPRARVPVPSDPEKETP